MIGLHDGSVHDTTFWTAHKSISNIIITTLEYEFLYFTILVAILFAVSESELT